MDWKNATWKERLENGLEGEGICAGTFCRDCPFVGDDKDCVRASMEETEYPWLYRHLLTTVRDFDDDAEIRARAAEMLDDDAREKFLGKAEEVKYEVINTCSYYAPVTDGRLADLNKIDSIWPRKLRYVVNNGSRHIGVFEERDMAYKVAELLNDDA